MTPPPARYATVATPPGAFTVVVTDDPAGGEVVLAALVLLGVTVAIAGIVLSRPHGSGADA